MSVHSHQLSDWLPTTKKEMALRGWEELDVILTKMFVMVISTILINNMVK